MDRIAVIDYGMGNLRSVSKALESLGAEVCVSDKPGDVAKAKKVIRDVWTVGPYRNLRIVRSESELAPIASLPDVVNVEPWIEPKLFGERQGGRMGKKFQRVS